MGRPRKLTEEQERQIAALTAEVGPREASRRAPELVGCEVSPATCSKLQRQHSGDEAAPLRQEAAEAADELPEDADDLDVLLHLRQLADKLTRTAGEKRLMLSCIDRMERLTLQIIKLREQKAPSRKVGILVLPPLEAD